MRIWINKHIEDKIPHEFQDSYILNILEENSKSNLKTDIESLWRVFRNKAVNAINEDLLVISISVFAADKRINRRWSYDAWTRDIELHIPVIEFEKWISVKSDLEKLLGFLSGDYWNIIFRKTDIQLRNEITRKKYNFIDNKQFEEVSLFSGGLDSFAGAIKLLEEGKKICFVGFREYGQLGKRQNDLFNILKKNYANIDNDLLIFYSRPGCPTNYMKEKLVNGNENTSRSRSFMFLAGALAVAAQIGEATPVNIPENGFIGINVPLTDSRKGSCSTRTTHPFFINGLNVILQKLGIKNQIINMYKYKTKGEIVEELKEVNAFIEGYEMTISCSHPCQSRYNKKTIPMNCGYCYPCIIRKASLNKIKYKDESYDFQNAVSLSFIREFSTYRSKADDIKAVLSSLNRYMNLSDLEIKSLIMQTGELTQDDLMEAFRVYTKTMEEIKDLVISEGCRFGNEILDYIGIEINE